MYFLEGNSWWDKTQKWCSKIIITDVLGEEAHVQHVHWHYGEVTSRASIGEVTAGPSISTWQWTEWGEDPYWTTQYGQQPLDTHLHSMRKSHEIIFCITAPLYIRQLLCTGGAVIQILPSAVHGEFFFYITDSIVILLSWGFSLVSLCPQNPPVRKHNRQIP